MKQFIYLLLIFSSFLLKAQDTNKKVKSPQIVTKLKIGKKATFGNKSIHFIKVTEDSRCPKGVSCVWAGQAKILIGLYENDTLLEEKEIIIEIPNKSKELLKSIEKTIYGYNLTPYPTNSEKIDPSTYYLELLVK
ncbi:hypothetical protein SAMN04487910_4094 [Aquimarina amphilecti]|uniref:Uncharacterized protein n=1 Tax=Aquimarina amphilecti TaxID=1038014 RepID=A0A1H7VG48_AQUAM|nr:hypothetical protein [Aquimarina amphilecti]SEM08271.1 hypothetical protein SAMN04487910_4094 [Aquimarina amphilecti]